MSSTAWLLPDPIVIVMPGWSSRYFFRSVALPSTISDMPAVESRVSRPSMAE